MMETTIVCAAFLPAVYFRKVRHNWVYFAEGLVVLTTLAYTGVYVYSASIHEHGEPHPRYIVIILGVLFSMRLQWDY